MLCGLRFGDGALFFTLFFDSLRSFALGLIVGSGAEMAFETPIVNGF